MEIHVALCGNDKSEGTVLQPFKTISKAASVAKPGDTVIVHEGEYREWVNPQRGGLSDTNRITYQAAEGEKAVIKGSEVIKSWDIVKGTVWKAQVSNTLFQGKNPYKEILEGDWLEYPTDYMLHTGDVYLNGRSLYEAKSLEDVFCAKKREQGMAPPWKSAPERILHPEETIYQWYAESYEEFTDIYANFQDKDPNQELVEINVRPYCFYPQATGINYITVRGFEMAQAACQWAPPTAEQQGLLGVHWSKGWIIENNIIHDAKCSGISIGKERTTGHNLSKYYHKKPGYQYQMEAVFRAKKIGWSKEIIGSHIIRNNVIYDCGQNGIVGHMGCAFSKIEHNEIYNIGVKHEFFGYEIAGIKLHAAVDVELINNNIHHCTLGTWLDWQAQSARISRSLYYANDRDLMMEVTHGPYLVDNNIFASSYNFDNVAQGGAYVHNLCCGIMRRTDVPDRSTPYHFPHTTDIAGCAPVFSGDDRLYQNVFVGGKEPDAGLLQRGTVGYNGCPSSMDEYIQLVLGTGKGDHEAFDSIRQPVYIGRNIYLNGALSYERETDGCSCESNPEISVYEKEGNTYLEFNIPSELLALGTQIVTGSELGMVRIVEASYENPDGSSVKIDIDYFGASRKTRPTAGPVEKLEAGHNCLCVWNRRGLPELMQ